MMRRATACGLLAGRRAACNRHILRLGHGRRRHLATAGSTAGAAAAGPRSSRGKPTSTGTGAGTRPLLTLAIETSCDDTCVAVLEKHGNAARLLANTKITSDNRVFRGIKPSTAVQSHTTSLGPLVDQALRALPEGGRDGDGIPLGPAGLRRKPDFITVTRGPGILSALSLGLTMAKGLAVAWQVPLVAVHHMQAHALTPRLVHAMEQPWPGGGEPGSEGDAAGAAGAAPAPVPAPQPAFPFMTLLVSGGHTQLLLSRSTTSHTMLAEAASFAIGDLLDKCARCILPADVLAGARDVMYGAELERFAFPPPEADEHSYDYGYTPPAARADEIQPYVSAAHGWSLTPLLSTSRRMEYDFTGFSGQVQALVQGRPGMGVAERRELARATMRLAFEHLASRVLFALDAMRAEARADEAQQQQDRQTQDHQTQDHQTQDRDRDHRAVKTLVVSGGVASNRFLQHVLTSLLRARGHGDVALVRPPPALCTDNAAMIAWTGMEMYEGGGWHSELDVGPVRRWPMDENVAVDADAAGGGGRGGILGVWGWRSWWAEEEEKKAAAAAARRDGGGGGEPEVGV